MLSLSWQTSCWHLSYLVCCKEVGFYPATGSEVLVAGRCQGRGCWDVPHSALWVCWASVKAFERANGGPVCRAPAKPYASVRGLTQGVPFSRATLKPLSCEAFSRIMTDGPAEALREGTKKKQEQL